MRLKRYSKNLAKCGLLLNLAFLLTHFCGCTYSTSPTFLKENIASAIEDIAKKEHGIDLKARLYGETVWIYMPQEDLLQKAEKPEKYLERFMLIQNSAELKNDLLTVKYVVSPVEEKEKAQDFTYNKKAIEKINDVWVTARRVIFSTEREKSLEPNFIYLIISDIKNGIEIRELVYYSDLKKVSYGFISSEEFQHRMVQESGLSAEAIGDKTGAHLDYYDFSLEDFVALQIQQRVRMKFQKPEVEAKADVDKEILKIIVLTVKIYNFRDFQKVELNNLFSGKTMSLSRKEIFAIATD